MNKKDKELLLKDLCARLPYRVYFNYNGEYGYEPNPILLCDIDRAMVNTHYEVEGCKPYLRPMSSMTETERKEYMCLSDLITVDGVLVSSYETFDWLIKNHFDFRGLIPKGLALEATEGMYK